MRRNLALLTAFMSALVVLVVAPGAAANDTPCIGTLTGTHDNVVVPPGATCIVSGANVLGNVKALQDSRLRVESSDVGGSVIGDKAAVVQVEDSTVREDIVIKEARTAVATPPGFISCGEFGHPCEVELHDNTVEVGNVHVEKVTGSIVMRFNGTLNPIRGNIKVEDNLVVGNDLFLISANRVAQNLQVFKNKGPNAKSVVANEVQEDLQCFENDPPFLSSGNVARQAQGQCTAAPLP